MRSSFRGFAFGSGFAFTFAGTASEQLARTNGRKIGEDGNHHRRALRARERIASQVHHLLVRKFGRLGPKIGRQPLEQQPLVPEKEAVHGLAVPTSRQV